jgi:hypothetical protein
VGLPTGEINNLVVIDIDDPDGWESLLEIEEQHGRPPETLEVETGGGGRHLYFCAPEGVKIGSRNGWRKGIDIKAEGGYVVAPPSTHASGRKYQWADGRGPNEVEIAELPEWLLTLLPRKDEAKQAPEAHHITGSTNGHASLLQRAQAYVAKAGAVSEGNRDDAAFRLAGSVAALSDKGSRLSESEIFAVLAPWNLRNNPPLPANELRKCVVSALTNGTPRAPKQSRQGMPDLRPADEREEPRIEFQKFKFGKLRHQYPRMKPVVIKGLLRQGETCNIISVSKIGKSWLGYGLALSVIAGQKWLGQFETAQGQILLVDNELHAETIVHRLPEVAGEMGVSCQQLDRDLDVWPLRGKGPSLSRLMPDFLDIEPGTFKLIILDAKYRFIEEGASENDNGDETRFYNRLDAIAEHTKAAVVLIHHSSKGSQTEKRVTDVGAGAGAQSRAADCHLVLREHEEPDVVVLEAAVRSFAPVEPLALKWDFPLWLPADGIDVSLLKGKQTRNEQRKDERDREGVNAIVDALRKWNREQNGPATPRQLRAATKLGKDRLQTLLDRLILDGQLTSTEIVNRGNKTYDYALPESDE